MNIKNINTNITTKKNTPMKHIFTSEELRPSARTIYFIKQLAYTYRSLKMNQSYDKAYCLN